MSKNDKIQFDMFIKGDLVHLVVLTEEIIEKSQWCIIGSKMKKLLFICRNNVLFSD